MIRKRRERWYSLDGQRRIHEASLRDNNGPKRVISLVVLLVLVLMMMQQVSDPKKVQKVATAVGLMPNPNQPPNPNNPLNTPIELPPHASLQPSLSVPPNSLSESLSDSLSQTLCDLSNRSPLPTVEFFAQALEHLLEDAPKDTISELVQFAFHLSDDSKTAEQSTPNNPDSTPPISLWISNASQKIQRWIELSDSTQGPDTPHDQLIELLRMLSKLSVETTITDNDNTIVQALRLALDRVLLKSFSDNTPWKSTERIPLARLLQKATSLSKAFEIQTIHLADLPTLSTQQLMSQTDTLRGQCFRIEGTIGMIEPTSSLILASTNKPAFASESQSYTYDVLWLKTDDPSGQPIQIYLPNTVSSSKKNVGEPISLAAIIAKRRAYASTRGGDVSPVVIAAYIQPDHSSESPSPSELPANLAINQALFKLRTTRDWLPPVDWKIPMDLIQSSLSKRLSALPHSLHHSPDSTHIQPDSLSNDLLATLATAYKFRTEIRQIVSANCYSILASSTTSSAPNQPENLSTSKVLGQWNGQITSIESLPVNTSEMPGLGWSQIYAIHLLPSTQPNTPTHKPIVALCTELPQSWKNQTAIAQPATIQGIGVFPTQIPDDNFEDPNNQPFYILASRVQWTLPKTPYPPCDDVPSSTNLDVPSRNSLDWTSPPLSEGWKSLALANWDLSFCDSLEKLHGTAISSADAEPLYSMLQLTQHNNSESSPYKHPLNTMEWIKRTESMKANKQSINDQHRSVGERVQTRFLVRRIQRVEVRNPEHQRWLGTSSYYQLDGLASIGNNRIAVRYGKGIDPITFEKEFPMTLVAANVPAWVFHDPNPTSPQTNPSITDALATDPPATELLATELPATDLPDHSIVWYPRIRIDVEGWAYRTWRFRTIEVSAVTEDTGFQQAPMLVVDRWKLAQGPEPLSNAIENTNSLSPKRTSTKNNLVSILTTLLGLAAIAWFAYRFTNSNKRPVR